MRFKDMVMNEDEVRVGDFAKKKCTVLSIKALRSNQAEAWLFITWLMETWLGS